MKKKTFFNLSMLSVSNIAVRILGLFYKVWLAKNISPVALGIYQLAMSVYSVFVTPVATGLPNATSRLCAGYSAQGKAENVYASAVKLSLFPVIFSTLIMILGKDVIAGVFLHESGAGGIILALIPGVTLGAMASIPGAYLHSREESVYPAIFEIIEQIFKILFAVLLIFMFPQLNESALIPTLAVSFGGVISFFMLFFKAGFPDMHKGGYRRHILNDALPPTVARMITALLHSCTTAVLPLGLIAYGLTREAALSQYGILTSMAYPVVFAPMTVLSALCVVTLPEIARHLDDYGFIVKKLKKNVVFTLLVTGGFSVLLLLLGPYAAKRFFGQPLAGRFMVLLIPSVIFLGLNHVMRTVLNGIGKQKTLMLTAIADGAVGLIFTVILSRSFGIYGFIAGNCMQDMLAFILNTVLLTVHLKKIKKAHRFALQ